MLKYKRGDASDHVPLEPEVPAQDANELWSVQRYSTEECDGRSNSSSTQVQLVMRGKRRFQEELNLNRLAVQFSAVQHRVSAASCGHDPEDDLDRNHAQVEEGCRDCPHFPSPHVNLTTRNHSTTRKSWRSDAPIILPGWEYHTGGSRSKPTVHRCRPKTGGCGLLTRTQNEPTKQHGSGVENQPGTDPVVFARAGILQAYQGTLAVLLASILRAHCYAGICRVLFPLLSSFSIVARSCKSVQSGLALARMTLLSMSLL